MGKFDLNPDELKKFDLTPEENAPKSKYPQPKSMSSDDQSLGLSTPPIKDATNLQRLFPGPNDPGGKPENWTNNPLESGDLITQTILSEAMTRALGAGPGFVKNNLPTKATPNAIPINAMSDFAKGGSSAGAIKGFLDHWKEKSLAVAAVEAAARNMGYVGPDIKALATAGARPATEAVGAVATDKASSVSKNQEPKPFKGTMSNAIDRLRVAAQSDARARELLSRIEGTNDAGTGEVTQSTLGAQQ